MNRMPAEWEPQSAVLIAWPHHTGDFTKQLNSVEESYAFIASTISRYQPLLIVCRNDDHQRHIQNRLSDNRNIAFIHAALNDIWVRDTVFLTVEQEGKALLLNFRFNGWGDKYPHQEDNALNHKLLSNSALTGNRHLDVDFILEGGSIESDGAGTLMTTRQCLLNPNRNQRLSQHEIEQQLLIHLGAEHILWLDQPNLAGDDTDAHIDTLARFCTPTTIAYTSCDDVNDRHFHSLQNMAAQLQAFRTRDGRPYHLIPLPLPKPIVNDKGQRLPANYANFLIINNAVMAPAYDDPMDAIAAQRLQDCFPDHDIIQTPCRPLVHQYGSLHCMTMQFPRSVIFTL